MRACRGWLCLQYIVEAVGGCRAGVCASSLWDRRAGDCLASPCCIFKWSLYQASLVPSCWQRLLSPGALGWGRGTRSEQRSRSHYKEGFIWGRMSNSPRQAVAPEDSRSPEVVNPHPPPVPRGDFLLRVVSPLIIFHVSSSIREKAPAQGESETSPAAPCRPYFLHI